jgi:lysozyme
MQVSEAGLALLKEFEGCRLKAYQDSVGVWTIGYGLTSAAGLIKVGPGLTITQAQADEYLRKALVQYEMAVLAAIKKPMTQCEFDAMTSLCYNIGIGNFRKSSVVRQFNMGNKGAAKHAFHLWCKAGGKVLPGLVRRRKAEAELFGTPNEQPPEPPPSPKAPEPIVADVAPAIPAPAPVEPAPAPVVLAPARVGVWAWIKQTFFS